MGSVFSSLNQLSKPEKIGFLVASLLAFVFMAPVAMDTIVGLMLLWMLWSMPDIRQRCAAMLADKLFRCVLALLALLALSVAWSPEWSVQGIIQAWLRILFCLCFFVALSGSLRELPDYTSLLSRAVILGALVSGLVYLFFYCSTPPDHDRLVGLFSLNNPGKAGRIFAAALPFLLLGILLDKGRWRLLGLMAFVVAILLVFLTGTRGAWLGATLGIMSYLVAAKQDTPIKFLALMAAGCLLVAIPWIVVFQYPDSPLNGVLFPRGDSFRFSLWEHHLQSIVQGAPFIGQGMLTDPWAELGEKSFRGAHSMYLSTALHIGIPGLMLFLGIVFWSSVRLLGQFQLPVSRLALSLLCVGMVAFIFSGDRLIDKFNFVWMVFWFPVAVAVAVGPLGAPPRLAESVR